ncbi:TraY domain-containing protein [Arthrobacter sp. H5]|uniref:type II toxin-antitoxin system RelB family antitoxin n=1 Tax=Arthrobacter sp. H5 TaxID=1267973 RepID=UPI0005693BD2|nr:TraY domain-containing protein [Arthrobacter sp. H5]
MNVRLDAETRQRLENLAKRTGRTKSFYAVEAIQQYLEEWEDYFIAKDALEQFRQSDDEAIDLKDMDWGE